MSVHLGGVAGPLLAPSFQLPVVALDARAATREAFDGPVLAVLGHAHHRPQHGPSLPLTCFIAAQRAGDGGHGRHVEEGGLDHAVFARSSAPTMSRRRRSAATPWSMSRNRFSRWLPRACVMFRSVLQRS